MQVTFSNQLLTIYKKTKHNLTIVRPDVVALNYYYFFSNVLASASVDCSITLWNFSKFTSDCNLEEVNVTHNPGVRTDSTNMIITNFRTKDSPCLGIHFTRRNLLIGVGASEV